jgi:hypothetical protein
MLGIVLLEGASLRMDWKGFGRNDRSLLEVLLSHLAGGSKKID